MTRARLAAAVVTLVALSSLQPNLRAAVPAATQEPLARFAIRWIPNPAQSNQLTVEVSGLSNASATELRKADRTPEQWQRLLSVHADQGDLFADVGLPAMLGAYRIEDGTLRFEPQFPLEPGVHYRTVFYPHALPDEGKRRGPPVTSVFQLPRARSAPSTVVSHVYPSGTVLPENLLKF